MMLVRLTGTCDLEFVRQEATLQKQPATVVRANWLECQMTKSLGRLIAKLTNVIEMVGAGKEYQVRVQGRTSVKSNANAG